MFTLITGASSGIGLEMALICAKRNQNLVLVARSEPALNNLANTIRSQSSSTVMVFPLDLSKPESSDQLIRELHRREIDIEILINNAGFGDHGPFSESDWQKNHDMIQVNILSLMRLTHLLLPKMIQRKQGRIMNVSSTASFQPGPYMAVYYATKAFVQSFSEALAEELTDSGVTVTALCPGPTASGFQSAANLNNVPLTDTLTLPSSGAVAEFGIQSMMAGKVVAIHGLLNSILVFLVRLTPRSMMRKIIKQLQMKRLTRT